MISVLFLITRSPLKMLHHGLRQLFVRHVTDRPWLHPFLLITGSRAIAKLKRFPNCSISFPNVHGQLKISCGFTTRQSVHCFCCIHRKSMNQRASILGLTVSVESFHQQQGIVPPGVQNNKWECDEWPSASSQQQPLEPLIVFQTISVLFLFMRLFLSMRLGIWAANYDALS